MPCNFTKPNVSLPKSTRYWFLFFVKETAIIFLVGSLNADGNCFGSLKFQLPALSHFVSEISDVLPLSSIHSLSSKVTSHVASLIIVLPCTKMAGTLAWFQTFTFILCLPAGTVNLFTPLSTALPSNFKLKVPSV